MSDPEDESSLPRARRREMDRPSENEEDAALLLVSLEGFEKIIFTYISKVEEAKEQDCKRVCINCTYLNFSKYRCCVPLTEEVS